MLLDKAERCNYLPQVAGSPRRDQAQSPGGIAAMFKLLGIGILTLLTIGQELGHKVWDSSHCQGLDYISMGAYSFRRKSRIDTCGTSPNCLESGSLTRARATAHTSVFSGEFGPGPDSTLENEHPIENAHATLTSGAFIYAIMMQAPLILWARAP